MKAEIISIGDEILLGHTINTNASYIGQRLTEIGIEVKWITSVGDNELDLSVALSIAEKRVDVVICTGGLGPTHDDMTKNLFVKYFNSKLILNEAILEKIKNYFKNRGVVMPKINEEQALVPDNAAAIENDVGTAPGLLFKRKKKHFFVLPGVPLEMKTMMDRAVIPYLKEKSTNFIKYKTIKTAGIGESALFEKLGNIEELEKFVSIAFLPKVTGVEIRINAASDSEEQCLQNIAKAESKITRKISEYIWGIDNENIEDVVAKLLLDQQKTVAIAESFTGGLICDKLTNIKNSSNFLKLAIIAHTKEAKISLLGISKELINIYGVVSSEVALNMAQKVRQLSGTDFGLATVGTAGVTKITGSKLEGLIYVAVADRYEMKYSELMLKRDRIFNKQRAAQLALDLLRRQLIA